MVVVAITHHYYDYDFGASLKRKKTSQEKLLHLLIQYSIKGISKAQTCKRDLLHEILHFSQLRACVASFISPCYLSGSRGLMTGLILMFVFLENYYIGYCYIYSASSMHTYKITFITCFWARSFNCKLPATDPGVERKGICIWSLDVILINACIYLGA